VLVLKFLLWKGPYNDPLEALQFKQWQSDAFVGNDAAVMEILIAPQLQEPCIPSGVEDILRPKFMETGTLEPS
jgi:hypothetical protein